MSLAHGHGREYNQTAIAESNVLSEWNESKYMFYVYILRNYKNKLYVGHSRDVAKRLKRHEANDGARFVKDFKKFELVYLEEYAAQLEAMRREKQLKGWTRAKKEALIAGNTILLKKL